MNFIESFNNKTILIPLLQRDYVQGSKNSAVITPFLDALLEKDCDLNYIYGYEEDECFVPVDGQQRLTTLWLLYLYLYSRKNKKKEYRVYMKFASREFAGDFCESIQEHLEDLLSKENLNKPLDEIIKDQNWFIQSWCNNATVNNMLGTLKVIHRKICSSNFDIIWNRLVENKTSSITFAFLQMNNRNGLDDDIYIKMNGRGRRLSAFENLKSWMDEKVSTFSFSSEWKSEMDNDWTNLFWQNRNRGQEHPEEIDDEQLFFFYNLLVLYHIKTGHLHNTIIDIREKDPYMFEELQSFLEVNSEADDNEITDKVIERLQKTNNIPLLWFDRLSLMPNDFFVYAFNSIREIVDVATEFNTMNLYIGDNQKKETTSTYQISMCEGSLDRTLPLFYALLSYRKGATSLSDWMRVMRNLILGTGISKDNIERILNSIHNFAQSCKDINIYELLSSDDLSSDNFGFNGNQFQEEKLKASWVIEDKEWIKLFNAFESISFCRGTIWFIFDFLPEKKNKQIFKEFSTLFHLLFGNSGVRYNITQHNLQRSLMCFTTHYGYGYTSGDKRKFMSSREEWHRFLNDSVVYENQPHNDCMKSLVYSLYKSLRRTIDLSNYKEEFCDVINTTLESIIADKIKNDTIRDWRYFFINYPSIWYSMGRSMCRWINDYDIFILGSSQWRNGNIRELRTFAFWQDIIVDKEKHPVDYKSCDGMDFDYYDDTCMYILHKCTNNRIVRIDVFYERGKPDQYRFRLFYSSKDNGPSEKNIEDKCDYLKMIADKYSFYIDENDHKYLSHYHSYPDAMSCFKNILKDLGNY